MSDCPVSSESASEGKAIETFEYSWRHDARLLSRGQSSLAPLRKIARGDLAEMVTLAIKLPTAALKQACVQPVATQDSFDWSEILAMSKRFDFPLSI